MRPLRPLLLVAVLGTLACANDGDNAAQTADAGESAGDIQLGPCVSIVDCATETDRPVTRLIAQYGEDGTCWSEFPTEACWQDCRAILSDTACAMTELCCECETATDCAYDPARPFCDGGSCVAEVGGNETVASGSGTDGSGTDTSGTSGNDTDPSGNDTSGNDTDDSGTETDGAPDLGDPVFPATEFLVVLRLSGALPTPIQLAGTVASQGGTVSFDLEYLALEVGSNDTPRTPTGEFLRVDAPVADDGTFEFAIDGTPVIGAANPIDGTDIEMSISVTGQVGADRICGALTGAVTVPIDVDLDGSAFSGIAVGDGELPAASTATCR